MKHLIRTLKWTLTAGLLVVGTAHAQSPEEIPLGSEMPAAAVQLSRAGGGQATLGSLQGSAATVVLFWSNQCPWVEKYQGRVAELASAYGDRGVRFVLINSNDPAAYPQEAASASAESFGAAGFPSSVTYLNDPSAAVAGAFGAERTPHVFVFDGDASLVYVGTIDDSPGDPSNVGEQYLEDALAAVVGGSGVPVPKTKAFGCTIKFVK